MSFKLEVDGLENVIDYVKTQAENRKRWKPKINKFLRDELDTIGHLIIYDVHKNPKTPHLTGLMKHRTKFKVVNFSKLRLYVDEPENDQYALAVHDGFVHYKSGKHIKGRPFLKNSRDIVLERHLKRTFWNHWAKQFNKKR